jgi:hypothetical protein
MIPIPTAQKRKTSISLGGGILDSPSPPRGVPEKRLAYLSRPGLRQRQQVLKRSRSTSSITLERVPLQVSLIRPHATWSRFVPMGLPPGLKPHLYSFERRANACYPLVSEPTIVKCGCQAVRLDMSSLVALLR